MKPLLTGLVLGLLVIGIANRVSISTLQNNLNKQSQSHSNLVWKTDSNTTNILIQFQQLYNGLVNHEIRIQQLWTNVFTIVNPLTNNTIGGKPVSDVYFQDAKK